MGYGRAMNAAATSSTYDPSMIESYSDYRTFFSDALDAMGRPRSDLAAHLEVSKSMLSQILSYDRRVNPSHVGRVGDFFLLDLDGRATLATLFDLDNDSARARRIAWASVQARLHYRSVVKVSDEVLELMANWHVGALHSLAMCEGFKLDARWIASVMVPNVTPEEAQVAIDALMSIGALAVDADGRAYGVEMELWTEQNLPPGRRSQLMKASQTARLELAAQALHRFRGNERHSCTAMFPVTEDRFLEIRARLRELERELIHIGTSPSPTKPNRVYSLGIQFFPLSEYSDAEHGSAPNQDQ